MSAKTELVSPVVELFPDPIRLLLVSSSLSRLFSRSSGMVPLVALWLLLLSLLLAWLFAVVSLPAVEGAKSPLLFDLCTLRFLPAPVSRRLSSVLLSL